MLSFVDNPEGRGREIATEEEKLQQHIDEFFNQYNIWNQNRTNAVASFEATFHTQLDDPFKQLENMTAQVLGCTDEELNAVSLGTHAIEVQGALKTGQAAFHLLRESAERGLEAVSCYSQEVFVKESGFYKLQEDVVSLQARLSSEFEQICRTRATYWEEFSNAQREFEETCSILREYDEKDGFSKLFIANPWDQYGGRRNDQEQLRNRLGWRHTHMLQLQQLVDPLLYRLSQARTRIDTLFNDSVEMEHKIIESKMVASEVYSKIYDMEVCLTNSEIEISVEEAIRHILALTYISLKMVDGDEHVRVFKGQILEEVSSKYGAEKTEELKQEKRFLALDI